MKKQKTRLRVLFIAKEVNQDKMVQQNEWLIDSGASKHMTCHEEILQNYQQFPRPQSVKLGDGRVVDALGFGNVKLKMTFKSSDVKSVTMFDVLYVPKLSGNLFSVGAAVKEEIRCSSKSLAVTIYSKMEISKEWEHNDLTGVSAGCRGKFAWLSLCIRCFSNSQFVATNDWDTPPS